MDDLLRILSETPFKVIGTLLTAAVLAALAVLSRTVRLAVFYRRHEFELPYSSKSSGCVWDIQWENLRATLAVDQVHNDHLEGLTVRTNDVAPGITLPIMRVGEAYVPITGPPPWFLKIRSIVRSKASGTRGYTVELFCAADGSRPTKKEALR